MINKIKNLFIRLQSWRRINNYVKEMERQTRILNGERYNYYIQTPIHFEDGVPPTLIQRLLGLIARSGQEIKSETDSTSKWYPIGKSTFFSF